MLKRGLVSVGFLMALPLLSGGAALASSSDAPVPKAIAAPVALAPAAPGTCAPTLTALLQQDAAPIFTPAVPFDPLPAATACTSCTIVRGCFSCGSGATDKAPCAITICCGVETDRVCGTCSNHCVPPPA